MGAIHCFVKSGPNKSKKNPDNPDYFVIEIGGTDRYYNVENDHCSQVLKSLVGRKAMIEFTGRDTDASISICGAGQQQNAPEPEPDEPPDFANQPRRERTPAPVKPQQSGAIPDLKATRHYLLQHANAHILAMDAAVYAATEIAKRHPQYRDPDGGLSVLHVNNMAMNIVIEMSKRCMIDTLPAQLPQKEAK